MALGDLSAQFESNGNPAIVSSGDGDLGGMSYGAYQLASNTGSVDEFLGWGLRQDGFYKDYARVLVDSGAINSDAFIAQWKELGTIDPGGFKQMQYDYIKHAYYDPAVQLLRNVGFNVDNHSEAMKNVIWSRAVQYGPGEVVNLFLEALRYVPKILEKVDADIFDYDMINGTYESNKSDEWISSRLSQDIYESVYNRMDVEKAEALAAFTAEIKEKEKNNG